MSTTATAATATGTAARTDSGLPRGHVRTPKPLAWLHVIGAFIGLVASTTLTVEKFELAENSDYIPSCTFGTAFTCSSVMESPQAAAFGIPNPLLGIAGFAAVMAIGVIMLTGAALPRWFRTAFLIGLGLATIFIHWLAYEAVYDIYALCIYCMVVWVVTIAMFWFELLRQLSDAATTQGPGSGVARVHSALHMLRYPILIAWLFVFAPIIVIEFNFI